MASKEQDVSARRPLETYREEAVPRDVEAPRSSRRDKERGRVKSSLSSASVLLVLACVTVAPAQVCIPEFEERPTFDVGGNLGTSALADLDEDGDLDLLTGLSFFLGDGAGGFDGASRLPGTGAVPEGFDVKVADFDQDGHKDLAMVMLGGSHMSFYYGRGRHDDPSELFEAPRSIPVDSVVTGIWHIDTADFNGDGRTDLIGISIVESDLLMLLNRGNRQFSARRHNVDKAGAGGRGGNHMLTVGDFDGDGRTDVATGAGGGFVVLFGDGGGGFATQVSGRLKQGTRLIDEGHRFRAADVDGDGRAELFATGDEWVLVYLGRDIGPAGLPDRAAYALPVSPGVRFLEIADVNADRVLDVTVVAAPGPRSVYRTFPASVIDGTLSFEAGEVHTTLLSGHGSVLAVGDMNLDSAPDLVLTTEDTGQGQVFLNTDACRGSTASRGDANADGLFNLGDAVALMNYLFGGGNLACAPAAEVNGDGTLNVSDAIRMLDYLFASGPAPVDPGPVRCE